MRYANAQKGGEEVYENLRNEISKLDVKQRQIASVLGIHENSLRNKIVGESSFSIEEAFKIKNVFFPNYELTYLFRNFPPSQVS